MQLLPIALDGFAAIQSSETKETAGFNPASSVIPYGSGSMEIDGSLMTSGRDKQNRR